MQYFFRPNKQSQRISFLVNSMTIIIVSILLIQAPLFAFSKAPNPTYFISCPNQDDDCFTKKNNRTQRPVPITEINKGLESSYYKYSILHNLGGTTSKVKIEQWHSNFIITKTDTISLHTIHIVDSYMGPRFDNDDKIFQFMWPLLWAGLFSIIESVSYLKDDQFNWKAPLLAFGISFTLVIPFTFSYSKKPIHITY
jgi:hypothetical protein